MDLNDYFDPVSLEKPSYRFLQIKSSFGGSIRIHTPDQPIQISPSVEIAIVGVCEDRNSPNHGAAKAPDIIRSHLYQLARLVKKTGIVDLGNLRQGRTVQDTYYAVREVIRQLIEKNICPVLIGGTQDITWGMASAYEASFLSYNLVTVDARLDVRKPLRTFDSTSYLNKLLFARGKKLFHYVNLGHQLYYLPPGTLSLLEKYRYESLGIGQIRSSLKEIEPVIRDADLLSIDMGAIKRSDSPGYYHPCPNGFYGEEICQISRYAGTSNRISSFGLFEANPSFDSSDQTMQLAAQIIWYFLDGFLRRHKEFPAAKAPDFTKYIVTLPSLEQKIVFYKSKNTDRWWMEVPVHHPPGKGKVIAACSYEDYLTAGNQEIPERWLKIFRKLN